MRAGAVERPGEQQLVVPVCAPGVEHGDPRRGGGRDRFEGELLVEGLVRRHAHAAEADSELRRRQPPWTHLAAQDAETEAGARADLPHVDLLEPNALDVLEQAEPPTEDHGHHVDA